ncbi:MAG: flagellar biosynthetic protein FliR [Polyangiales bacterium]
MSPWGLLLASLRVAPAVALLPLSGLGPLAWPSRVAVAVALAAGVAAAPDAPWVAAWWGPCARELLVGGALALVLALPWMALEQGASLLSAQGDALEPAGRAARWAGAVTFVAARGHHGALRALAASWVAVPPGGAPASGEPWLSAALDATAEALAGALVVASSGLLGVAAAELVVALAGRFGGVATREAAGSARAIAGVAAVAIGLRAAAEVAVALGQRAHALAVGMR